MLLYLLNAGSLLLLRCDTYSLFDTVSVALAINVDYKSKSE